MHSTAKRQFEVIFVLGPPGCGKGTQSQLIEKYFGFLHLSAGDLIRREVQRDGSTLSTTIEKFLEEGQIIPSKITCKLIVDAMSMNMDMKAFVIDGFPRSDENIQVWNREVGETANVRMVLYLGSDMPTCKARCLNRSEGRNDDNVRSFEKRVDTYYQKTLPVIEHYRVLGLLREVLANVAVDKVFDAVRRLLENEGYKSI